MLFFTGAKLTNELRATLNTLTRNLNEKMAEAAEIANLGREPGEGRVQHVPINEKFNGHRFCEEGVTEPNYDNSQSWFLLHASSDHVPPGALLPQPDPTPPPFEGPTGITDALCAAMLSKTNVTAGIEFGQYMACTVAEALANGERLADYLNSTDEDSNLSGYDAAAPVTSLKPTMSTRC